MAKQYAVYVEETYRGYECREVFDTEREAWDYAEYLGYTEAVNAWVEEW